MSVRSRMVMVLAVLSMAVGGLGTASATRATPDAQDDTRVPEVVMTSAQRQALQEEVDQHLKNYGGGTQIGINEISYENGQMIVTLPLPGERRARAVDEPIAPNGVPNCPFEFACLWSDTNFNGTRIARAPCTTITLAAPFNTSTASVHNNQTLNTQTMLLNSSRQILHANRAESKVHDLGVLVRPQVRFWQVCP